jgi:hypothetical protein
MADAARPPGATHGEAVLWLPTRETSPPRTWLGRWLASGGRLDEPHEAGKGHRWYLVMCLTGVDYFSSLAYQPGIALLAAGALSPTATLVLVAVTLFGALPVYMAVARRSYAGQGSIALLENLISGWKSKIFVLVLLGFAATDFVITMTLSAADAARHAVQNPYLRPYFAHAQLSLTVGLLLVLAIVFLIGFREAIDLAAALVVPFLLLNLVVLGAGVLEILRDPVLIRHWQFSLHVHGDWTGILLASGIIFPKLALGLSGFETGVSVMPLVENGEEKSESGIPEGRIRHTKKLLATAAVIMGFYLVLSSIVTTLLVPESAYRIGGPAAGRTVAYLAHHLLGNAFGSVFDLSTIVILWFAGASAMAGLINIVPRYLPRFGMAPRWISYRRPMVLALFVIDLLVTLAFHASVEAQGGAYATGVLVLILSAAVAAAIAFWREFQAERRHLERFGLSLCLWVVSLVFVYTLGANVVERPDGVIISTIFILAVLLLSGVSRYRRSRELRVSEMAFADAESAQLWPLIVGKKVNLVPLSFPGGAFRASKTREIRERYKVSGPLAFLHIHLLDNRSEFISRLRVRIRREEENFLIEVWGAVAVANTIAYVSELINPASIFLELTGKNLMEQSMNYLFLGEGETGLMVYTILVRYWEWAGTDPAQRPALYLTSS